MPRGVKKVIDLDEQLKVINEKIAVLESERKEVLGKKRATDLQAINELMTMKGISPQEVIDMLSPAVAAATQISATEA